MTLRDADRFKDKVEVSLDTRQIFFLFFGGAVVASLVFVLGVMVGRRLESREQVERRAATSGAVDPLAALDELGADERKGAPPRASAADAVPERKGEPGKRADEKPAAPGKPAAPPPPPAALAPPAAAAAGPAAGAAPAPVPAASAAATPTAPTDVAKDKSRDKADKKKAKGKYTLQLSSFQDKREAEAFAARMTTAGYKPYIVESDVPDRGIFFRVRVGEYAGHEDALAAKNEFEASQHIIAYVTRL